MSDSNAAPPQLDDDALNARISLATEVILTSGTITAEDVARGWYEAPDPTDEMQRAVIVLGLTIICGGLDGAPVEVIAAAWSEHRLLVASITAMLEAVQTIKAEAVK